MKNTMKRVRQIGGATIIVDDKTANSLIKRIAFCEAYCKKMGWSLELGELSIEQVLEIRKQQGWINPK